MIRGRFGHHRGKRVAKEPPAAPMAQCEFDFSAPSCPVIVLRPSQGSRRAAEAYALYLEASEIDEDPETLNAAEARYERAIQLDPGLAIAYTNLGNIRHRRGDLPGAEALYRTALSLDRRQPEAQYNLGYCLLDGGDAERAIALFLGALEADPKFADACFNLATAYEQTHRNDKAQPLWRRYLALEPSGTWAEIARSHLR